MKIPVIAPLISIISFAFLISDSIENYTITDVLVLVTGQTKTLLPHPCCQMRDTQTADGWTWK